MIVSLPFQTLARTVDHLGREQIADCPTAISELWKNAYDAYAQSVALHIFDGEVPVACICDDGHGMSRDEFVNKWLVIGTESKTDDTAIPREDKDGLRTRPKLGQKGIGRLSCANIGPLLLLVSKRKDNQFVASLIDWRLFENPFLVLSDIKVPVVEFDEKHDLFKLLPDLFEQLMANVWGDKLDKGRKERIVSAWKSFDDMYESFAKNNPDKEKLVSPSKSIAETIIATAFEERHIDKWGVWNGKSEKGTALLFSGLNFDLDVYTQKIVDDVSAKSSREKFFETLSSFVDPFIDQNDPGSKNYDPQFSYTTIVWNDNIPTTIVGSEQNFNLSMVESTEHILKGHIGDDGVFRGSVTAFGKPRGEVEIEPPKDLKIPKRKDWKLGQADLFIAALEFQRSNTTHTDQEFAGFKDLAEKYSGFMVFRDGLRVLPFGRKDNDFFEIDERRSRNAGREYWNHRQMFGRIAITRSGNPNLIDKAGREGLTDNRAAKTLKAIISNILMQSARRWFGSASELRKEILPGIKDDNQKKKASKDADKLRKKNRKKFIASLEKNIPQLEKYISEIRKATSEQNLNSEDKIEKAQEILSNHKMVISEFGLGPVPANLGTLEDDYKLYQNNYATAVDMLNNFEEKIWDAVDAINLKSPRKAAEKSVKLYSSQINQRINKWKGEIDSLQKDEFKRVKELIEQRKNIFNDEMVPVLDQVESENMILSDALKLMEGLRVKIDKENADLFEPYIGALESLQESIDLENIANFGIEETSELRQEVDRLNSLAQMGIAVEIVGHELESFDRMIGAGIKDLPDAVRSSDAVASIELGYEGITNQLRFLNPLKLAGNRTHKLIDGEEVYHYILKFFESYFRENNIQLNASKAFLSMKVYEQPSRLFPVFVNLTNNSLYWLSHHNTTDKQILFDVNDGRVIIADNGPGVDDYDVKNIFTLFFTKKLKGGRGVGLYLCRANLTAGGHRIDYVVENDKKILSGANFEIDFRGAEYA